MLVGTGATLADSLGAHFSSGDAMESTLVRHVLATLPTPTRIRWPDSGVEKAARRSVSGANKTRGTLAGFVCHKIPWTVYS